MRKFGLILAAAAGLVASLVSDQAYAILCQFPTTVTSGMTVPIVDLVPFACVRTSDLEYDGPSSISTDLPAGAMIRFDFSANESTITFEASFVPGTYTFSYSVEVLNFSNFSIGSLLGDFAHSGIGPSTLMKNTVETGIPSTGIDCTKTTGGTNTCPGKITYPGPETVLLFTETLNVNANDQVEAVIDSVSQFQSVTVPEPASLGLLAAGLVGFGLFRRWPKNGRPRVLGRWMIRSFSASDG